MAAQTASFGFPVLVGDIGGTNARFALVADPEAAAEPLARLATADFPSIEAAIEASLPAGKPRPRSAIIDMAGPIGGEAMPLTNAHWVLRPRDIIAATGIGDVVLLNDFEALALALPALRPADLTQVGGGAASPGGARVVLGPGTGLGVGALIRAGDLWIPVPGEGGHVALGPVEPDEFPVWAHIEPEHGRISAEALLSGRGLTRLYRAVAVASGAEPDLSRPAEITAAALAGRDEIAARTVSLYARLLGRLAGDMALVFMARGGAYIGGGIAPRILPFITGGEFRRAFEAKAPHEAAMAAIPAFVINAADPALAGLAAFAQHPERYGVGLDGRRWS